MTTPGEKVTTFAARAITIALAGMLSACASSGAKTPRYSDRHLRPMNEDLRAWLDRLNAMPVGTSPATSMNEQTRVAVAPPAPQTQLAPAPSPGAAPTSPATALTPPDVVRPAVAVAAGAPQQHVVASAAPAKKADPSHTPGSGPQPAPPPFSAEGAKKAPEVATADGKLANKPAETIPAPLPPPPKPVWAAENGTSLRYSVSQWAKRAGWTVVWDAEVDYPIAGTLSYEGEFVEAVAGIFRAHSRSTIPLRVDIYPRQKLIHIPKE
ncbi:toxin co-regulated pilus biosynthesis Q family protein [Xanthomonas campestris pv. raphani]|uniref:toxin co-regulated pilus biosynthesis Q family protein n=2 Tax=Xanthomonas campestris TaxID=339 RepID=UPI002B223414|nr:toxin co-regulated pilus biosynthesis Q family protein [Xanthomonas campestris]MEA9776954.1 toxin co-regulated pilus biosynthesis Q family protein [Xanthomonas campestris pv. raphani]